MLGRRDDASQHRVVPHPQQPIRAIHSSMPPGPHDEYLTTCEVCGFEWAKGDARGSASHRQYHRERLKYLQPKPSPRYLRSRDPERNIVDHRSPIWKRWEMYGRAAAFAREMRYVTPQWTDPHRPASPKELGILFEDDDVIVGACGFRLRRETYWLDWIWIAPAYRRSGVLTRYWPSIRERFGDFPLTREVSPSMQAFVRKAGDGHLLELDDLAGHKNEEGGR